MLVTSEPPTQGLVTAYTFIPTNRVYNLNKLMGEQNDITVSG